MISATRTAKFRAIPYVPYVNSYCTLIMIQYYFSITKAERESKSMPSSLPVCGILTGISYVSGLDYYSKINAKFGACVGKRRLMPPNPEIVMVSVDCDQYSLLLTERRYAEVSEHLASGVARLVRAGVDFVVMASNTAHMCVPTLLVKYPQLKLLHIADSTARSIRASGEEPC